MSEAGRDDRLREAVVRLVEEAREPLPYSADRVPAEAFEDAEGHVRERRQPKPRWPIIVGVAAVAALTAVAAVAVWDRTPGETVRADILVQPTSTEPVGVEWDGLLGWSRVPHSNEIFAGGPETVARSVIAGGPGLVAVGHGADGNSARSSGIAIIGKVWTSVDGHEWSLVPFDEEIFGAADVRHTYIVGVALGGPGLVAVGTTAVPDSRSNDQVATVWTSVDGLEWTRVPENEEVFGGEFRTGMSGVAAGERGLVAVGSTGRGELRKGVIWRSVNGRQWTRVPDSEELFGGRSGTEINSVTVGGPGFVAVGSTSVPGSKLDDRAATVWTSVDGLEWTRVPHNPEVFGAAGGAHMNSVTAGGPGLVAVGYTNLSEEAKAAVWTSADGLNWNRVPHSEETFGGTRIEGVTVGGPGLVAVGWTDDVLDGGVGVVWTSVDGLTWMRVADDESDLLGGLLLDVAPVGPSLVVVGAAIGEPTLGQYGTAAIWTTSPQS